MCSMCRNFKIKTLLSAGAQYWDPAWCSACDPPWHRNHPQACNPHCPWCGPGQWVPPTPRVFLSFHFIASISDIMSFSLAGKSCFSPLFKFEEMQEIVKNFTLIHIDTPGQEEGAALYPAGYGIRCILTADIPLMSWSNTFYFWENKAMSSSRLNLIVPISVIHVGQGFNENPSFSLTPVSLCTSYFLLPWTSIPRVISSRGAQEDFAAHIVTASQPPGDLGKFILLLISLKSLQIKVLVTACAERCNLQDTAAVLFKDIQKMNENYQRNSIKQTCWHYIGRLCIVL